MLSKIKADLLGIDRMLQKLIEIGPGLRATSQASKIRIVLRRQGKKKFRCTISKLIKMSKIIMIE
jgi:hypothetical protein